MQENHQRNKNKYIYIYMNEKHELYRILLNIKDETKFKCDLLLGIFSYVNDMKYI